LYRDVSAYPEPDRSRLQADLREYTRNVIDNSWPLQRKQIIPKETNDALGVDAGLEGSQVGLKLPEDFNHMVELRCMRLHNVQTGLPGTASG
jgi:hypothetical protein